MKLHVVGIDPGLVDTGLVRMEFDSRRRRIGVAHAVVSAPLDHAQVVGDVLSLLEPATVFIEGYRPRAHMNTDKRMVELVAAIKKSTGGKVLDNTGIKKVVHQALLELLGVWVFTTPTHHQDLRSAARIMVLGMLKDTDYNSLLTTVVRDHLNHSPWLVHAL